jgi:hypothetical protein
MAARLWWCQWWLQGVGHHRARPGSQRADPGHGSTTSLVLLASKAAIKVIINCQWLVDLIYFRPPVLNPLGFSQLLLVK